MVVSNLLDGYNYASDVVVQPNGQIVVVGEGYNGTDDVGFVARYNPDGTLDASFGTGGIVVTTFYASHAALALQDDGSIVVASDTATSGSSTLITLARFLPTGTLDPQFGNAGTATLSLGASVEDARAVAIQSDGKIVVAGDYVSNKQRIPIVARFLPNGSPDSTFDGVGYASLTSLSGNQTVNGVGVQPDGKIVVGGTFGIWQVDLDGSTDTTWGSGGVVTTSVESSTVVPIYALTVSPDGQVLAAGPAYNGTDHDFAFLSYNANGGLNQATTKSFGADDYAEALALSNNAQCVIAGYTGPVNGAVDDFAAWQLDLRSAPTATVSGPTVAVPGQPIKFALGAVSPSLRDEAGGFTYSVNWGGQTSARFLPGAERSSRDADLHVHRVLYGHSRGNRPGGEDEPTGLNHHRCPAGHFRA